MTRFPSDPHWLNSIHNNIRFYSIECIELIHIRQGWDEQKWLFTLTIIVAHHEDKSYFPINVCNKNKTKTQKEAFLNYFGADTTL